MFVLMNAAGAQARVFSFEDESFGAYFRSTRSSTAFTNTLLSKSNATTANPVTMNSEVDYNFSGEVGMVYAYRRLAMRIGLEAIIPPAISNRKGEFSDGTEAYRVTSEVSVIMPKVTMEVNLMKWSDSKVFLFGGAGSANLTGRNSYVFTSAGSTALGVSEYYEDLRGVAVMGEGGLGYERILFDTTSFVVEGGYRAITFTKVNQNRDVTTMNGAVVKGDKALNADGSDRAINLSGVYASLSFRIWIY